MSGNVFQKARNKAGLSCALTALSVLANAVKRPQLCCFVHPFCRFPPTCERISAVSILVINVQWAFLSQKVRTFIRVEWSMIDFRIAMTQIEEFVASKDVVVEGKDRLGLSQCLWYLIRLFQALPPSKCLATRSVGVIHV